MNSDLAKVYIWATSDTNPGHVSLELDGAYISYWPIGEDSELKNQVVNPPGKGNLKDFKYGVSHSVTFSSSYKVDRRLERKEADYILTLQGLYVQQMRAQWEDFKKNPKRYNMKSHNCSTVVASFLEVGSGIPYGKTPCIKINSYVDDPMRRFFYKLRFLWHSINMWTPNDVHLYVLQIKSSKGFS